MTSKDKAQPEPSGPDKGEICSPSHQEERTQIVPEKRASEATDNIEAEKRAKTHADGVQTRRKTSTAEPSRPTLGKKSNRAFSIFPDRMKRVNPAARKENLLNNAVLTGDINLLRDLLDAGASPNGPPKMGEYGNPLAAAAYTRKSHIVRLLLDRGADANIQIQHPHYGSALVAAVLAGSEDSLSLLLDRGADVDMQTIHGEHGSALSGAASTGNDRMVQLLLDAGANPNAMFLDGNRESAAAACRGKEDVVSWLLQTEIDDDQRLNIGSFPAARLLSGRSEDGSIPLVDEVSDEGFYSEQTSELPSDALEGNNQPSLFDYQPVPRDLVCAWELPSLINEFTGAKSFVMNMPTLTKMGNVVKILPCDKYLSEIYGGLGIYVLESIMEALAHGEDGYRSDDGHLKIKAEQHRITISSSQSAIQVHQIVMWICLTFRKPMDHAVFLSTGAMETEEQRAEKQRNGQKTFRDLEYDAVRIRLSTRNGYLEHVKKRDFEGKATVIERLEQQIRPIEQNKSVLEAGIQHEASSTRKYEYDRFVPKRLCPLKLPTSSDCWREVFQSAVVAQGPLAGLGGDCWLDVSFHEMVRITAVEYPVTVGSGLVLMGYSTALIPICFRDEDTIIWHFETAIHKSQFKKSELTATKRPWLSVQDIGLLQSKKALLGWCPEASVQLGTNQLHPDVRWSDGKIKRSTLRWTGANLQVQAQTALAAQVGATGGLTFERTPNTLQFTSHTNYLMCLANSREEQIVLYDGLEERGWLVPLICVLHHMLLAWASRNVGEKILAWMPTAEPSSDGGAASFAVLQNAGDFVVLGSGVDKVTIRDLVMAFSINLSKTLCKRRSGQNIIGYEFMDIVTQNSQSELKKYRIKKNGISWVPLLGEVSCLICSGLGDAIIGKRNLSRSSSCNRLPHGVGLMAASMVSINHLSGRNGNMMHPQIRKLLKGHLWQLAGSPFKRCHHSYTETCWENARFLQDIHNGPSDSQAKQNIDEFEKGAVVFGGAKEGLIGLVVRNMDIRRYM